MPKITSVPQKLRPYLWYGLELNWRENDHEATGACPFCEKEGKFYVSSETGLWRCFHCETGTHKGGGNLQTFMRLLWEQSSKQANGSINELARDRSLLFPDTLIQWGVVRSFLSGDWLVPGYRADGKLIQLYRYLHRSDKRLLFATPGVSHGIHRPISLNKSDTVYLCEGPWDGMALWEVLHERSTSSTEVLAIPGCGSVGEPLERWLPLFTGKKVILLFDSDHPKNGHEPHGYAAMKKAAQLLSRSEGAAEVHYLHWGKDGYDPSKPSGYDVRDCLNRPTMSLRIEHLEELLGRVKPVPGDWVKGRSIAAIRSGSVDMDCLPCKDWKTLVNSWRKALKWTDGLDRALSVMLACVTSTKAVGDQLWCKIIGPPSSGKSVLCEALSVNRRYVTAKSTIRGFHSGFKTDKEGQEDNSLIPKIKDKTLVTKDGDTLLQAPNLGQILSEARDLYDSTARTHYRNKTSRDYHGIRMTWLLCGTESLRQLDQSELGERFLDCVVVDQMAEEVEDEIGWRVALRAEREMSFESDGKPETQEGPEMVLAKQLTGGYVDYLRFNAPELLSQVFASESALKECQLLAKFISYMRARPSLRQQEKAQRELSFRLISQLVRLAKCLAVVLNRKKLDEEVMARVKATAMDTSRGRTLNIVRHLDGQGEEGLTSGSIASLTGESEDKERTLLRFLRKIGVTEKVSAKGLTRWRLTAKLRRIYTEVIRNA